MSETTIDIVWGTSVTIDDEKLPPRACRGIVVKTFGGAPGSYKIMFDDGSTAWFYRKDFTVNSDILRSQVTALTAAVSRIKILADDPVDEYGYSGFCELLSRICTDAMNISSTHTD